MLCCALSYVHAVTIYYGWRETRALDTTCAPVCGARDEGRTSARVHANNTKCKNIERYDKTLIYLSVYVLASPLSSAQTTPDKV